ncbi:MAG: NAD-dependent epimerase [Sterolibacterium sp.]|nr:NAD-dependent epimerase [Sterolibacterium sp.]
MKILVTGCAGFIGMHVCERLLSRGEKVIGVDNLNDYYAVSLKEARLARLLANPRFRLAKLDIADRQGVAALFEHEQPQRVIHLAAQAGVRYSLKNPQAYVDSNLVGFANILEGCRHAGVGHFVYASSSSVYGGNTRMPFSEHDNVDHPVSLYAATKKANELMAHSYSHLFALPSTGLRFFTVYGPWGRPDMSPMLFAKAILENQPIDVFNQGKMHRDFTYIDDVAEGVLRILDCPPVTNPAFDKQNPDPATSWAPYRICNIGNQQPVDLLKYIETLEQALGKTARKNFLPMQDGDVPTTYANTEALHALTGFFPATSLEEGVKRFVEWYREYFKGNA